MQVHAADQPDALIDSDESEAGKYPAPQLILVAPTRSNVQDRSNKVSDLEGLIARPSNNRSKARHKKPSNEFQRPHTYQKLGIHIWLRRIDLGFYDCPANRM